MKLPLLFLQLNSLKLGKLEMRVRKIGQVDIFISICPLSLEGCTLTFQRGEMMEGPKSIPVPQVAPGKGSILCSYSKQM